MIEQPSTNENVFFCSQCTISNQRPRITFDQDGVCSACSFAKTKRTRVDWEAREEELNELLDQHRNGPGEFDVVVPCSGGKDGGFVAHQLKYRYGMRVLAVTWAPLRATDLGRKNLESFIDAGFDHVLGRPDPRVTSRLTRESIRVMGDPFLPFIYGQTNFPVTIAKKYGASLVFYGENGEVEYGGDMTNANNPVKLASKANVNYFSGISLDDWKRSGFSPSDLALFMPPKTNTGVEQRFFGHYKFWDPQENFYYASEHLGFEPSSERSEGTYSRYASLDDRFDGFHFYFAYLKFGIGRTTSDTAHEIRDGKITRSEGIALVKKYDGEFPAKHFEEFLEFAELSAEEFEKIADSWRSEKIWRIDGEGKWALRKPIWEI